MGLRTILKGLRPSQSKETPRLTAPADKNSSLAPGTSNSQALQPGASNSRISLAQDDNTPRDLWDEAYLILSKEDPRLFQRYEEIIATEGDGNGDLRQKNLGQFVILLQGSCLSDVTGVQLLLDHITARSSFGK
jgi:hypothetical protein